MTRHLLHIGFAKTGSTFLQRWFAEHPQLAFADGGIAGYRDVYAIARGSVMPRADIRYHVTSYEGLTTPHRYAGEALVEHGGDWDLKSAQSRVCATLASLFPSATIFVVTRGFRSMILSSYSQYVRSGGDDRLAELVASPVAHDPWNYDHVVDVYTGAFGEENVIVMPYEMLRDDPDRFVRILEDRLGLTHHAALPDRVNPSLSPEEMYWYALIARGVRRLPIGASLQRRVLKVHVRAVMKNRLRRPLSLLRRLRPDATVAASIITDAVLEQFRGKAERLRANPLNAPYASDYLW